MVTIFGGRPGIIAASAGAMAVVQSEIVEAHGPEYVYACMVVAGGVQMILGFLRAGKYINLISEAVMIGFLNGLGAVIFWE